MVLALLRWLVASLALSPVAWGMAALWILLGGLLPWLSPLAWGAPVSAAWGFPAALTGCGLAVAHLRAKSDFLERAPFAARWSASVLLASIAAGAAQGALMLGDGLGGGGGAAVLVLVPGLLLQAVHCAAWTPLVAALRLDPATSAWLQMGFVWVAARASAEAGAARPLLDAASAPMRSPSLLDSPRSVAAAVLPVVALLLASWLGSSLAGRRPTPARSR